ncbi:putative P2Y purinoceptor 10 [Nothobranchius furzeri]|uniref:P2Y receptor family member 10 n=1 Tax=Nothobranchius furzeri TaxID=105023 RepID=A0A1A7ZA83_NOTFU|nr:transcript variant X1 [Nothobranchius furzeri]KAF7227754.1 transcript variant X2 [Nothobranchius furzeri]
MNPNTTSCSYNLESFDETLEKLYTYFYLLLFIPGLLLNTIALWVLCRHIRKKTKAVIFMINLALADLLHILSLPLRIYYYFTHTWPFGKAICLLCFYLKFFNMYTAIFFLMCISVQRYVFLLSPFTARRWRRRYDMMISMAVWVVVGMACSVFILMRSSSSSAPNVTDSTQIAPTHLTSDTAKISVHLLGANTSSLSSPASKGSCFKDLPIRKVSLHLVVIMVTFNELFGFFIPLMCIGYCSIRVAWSLTHKPEQKSASLGVTTRSRLQSILSSGQTNKSPEKPMDGEKRRALRMVLSCATLFLVCFAPYHINFLLYALESQSLVSHCPTRLAVKQFHPVSLCLASLSSCLNPLLYYFVNVEFRMHLIRTSSFTSSVFSSPLGSPTECPTQTRLLRLESSCSERKMADSFSGVD